MDLYRIIYSSQPFGYDEAALAGILVDARRCNERDGVTGALVCRRDVFLQLIEGPRPRVLDTFERIRRDDRHVDVAVHLSGPVPERLFGGWAMLHDPAASWFEAAKGRPADWLAAADADEISALFTSIAAKATAAPAR
ncbi:BLUF domain-containing protein [Roseibacterium sp. SDUM158017]|uniref:BLUF domain-containing protein n=1 Tax=Roseicyclus salinarum TaxID=3036773 RepID=UPI00241531E7|nr:BLUF domain-containing protein [Roseibacterium sp. SDUM158017]MDG4649272.1 BLUF domain-containing protein [Roseibacterium sp. SDUM158017]